MDSIDKTGGKLSDKGQGMVSKAKRFANASQIKQKMSIEEEVLQNVYTELGKMYYKLTKAPQDAKLKPHFSAITKCLKKIETYQQELRTVNGEVLCPHCKAAMPEDAPFCSVCGKRMTKKPVPNIKKKTCYLCGTVVDKNTEICTNCGARLQW